MRRRAFLDTARRFRRYADENEAEAARYEAAGYPEAAAAYRAAAAAHRASADDIEAADRRHRLLIVGAVAAGVIVSLILARNATSDVAFQPGTCTVSADDRRTGAAPPAHRAPDGEPAAGHR